eukprot:g18502.t1
MEPDVECPDVDPETFSEKGFTILPELIAPKVCEALNVRLEHLLKGDYDLGVAPSKVPGAKELRRYGSGGSKVNTLRQMGNALEGMRKQWVHATVRKMASNLLAMGLISLTGTAEIPFSALPPCRAASPMCYLCGHEFGSRSLPIHVPQCQAGSQRGVSPRSVRLARLVRTGRRDAQPRFQRVVLSPVLGRLAATLGGWSGARVAEDQVWIKPPGAGPLVFHRDSPYFDFEPDHVITIWIALDAMTPELGPLEYVVGSHRWEGRRGTAAQLLGRQRYGRTWWW